MAIPSTEQQQVGPLGALNFPQRKWRPLSLSACVNLCQFAHSKAQELFMDSNNKDARLRRALTILGIPESEFYKFQKEQERER
jgi:hypothetical protein